MTIYSKPGCAPCANLKLFLKRKNVEFNEEPIEPHMQRFYDLGLRMAPVVEVNGKFMSGNISRVWDAINRAVV